MGSNGEGLTKSGWPLQKGTSPSIPRKRFIPDGEIVDESVLRNGQSGAASSGDPDTKIDINYGDKFDTADQAAVSQAGANIDLFVVSPAGANFVRVADSEASASELHGAAASDDARRSIVNRSADQLVSEVDRSTSDLQGVDASAVANGPTADRSADVRVLEDDRFTHAVSVASASAGYGATADVVGSWIHKKRPSGEWVKTNRPNGFLPPTGSKISSGLVVPATTVKQTGVEVGLIADIRQSAPDLEGSAPSRPATCLIDKNTHSEYPILGLGEDDFPPIRPLSVSGASIEASKFVSGSEKLRARSVVNASLSPAYTQSQPVRLGSRTDKGFVGRGRGATAAVLHLDDAEVSHNWRSLFMNRPKPCSTLAFYNPSTVDGKVTVNPPPEAVAEGVGIWEGSLVGQFFDKRLPLHVIKSFVERLWGKHEIPGISTTDMGCTFLGSETWLLGIGYWIMGLGISLVGQSYFGSGNQAWRWLTCKSPPYLFG